MAGATTTTTPASRTPAGTLAIAIGVVLGLIAAGTAAYYLLESLHVVPAAYTLWVRVAVVAGIGYLVVVLVGRVLLAGAQRWTSAKHAGLIHSGYRLVGYVLLAVAILYAAGINGYALLAGGTFAGLVIGLASQTALANFVSGMVLLVSRPFDPGDRITLVSSQYNFLMPSYPPKFFSQDLLLPGFTGVVLDIGLVFTVLRLDDGPTVTVPNSLVLGAAIVGHSLPERWVRVKYEVPTSIPPDKLLARMTEVVQNNHWVIRPELVQAFINQATLASYIVSIDAMCRGSFEEPPRSSIYLDLMRVVHEFTEARPDPTSKDGAPAGQKAAGSPRAA
jgi:small conductance mechanosensitive channel